MNSKKDNKPEQSISRRNFIGKGSLFMAGGMFTLTNLTAADIESAPDQPIVRLLKLKVSGSSVAQRLTPKDILAIASPDSPASQRRIKGSRYLKQVSYRDLSALSDAMVNKFGNGSIRGLGDVEVGDVDINNDGGEILACCCCCCCCA